jgi:hypothetical protein
MYNKVHRGKHLSDNLPTQNGRKGDALSPLFFSFPLKMWQSSNVWEQQ